MKNSNSSNFRLILILIYNFSLLAGASYLVHNGWSLWTYFWTAFLFITPGSISIERVPYD